MRRNFLYNQKLKDRGKEMRKEQTPSEKKIWYQLLNKSEFRFVRQKPLGNYIADFYCAKLKLVIEIDGSVHFTDEAAGYDFIRTAYLEGLGLKVIRFTNDDISNRFEMVCKIINDFKPPLTKGDC